MRIRPGGDARRKAEPMRRVHVPICRVCGFASATQVAAGRCIDRRACDRRLERWEA